MTRLLLGAMTRARAMVVCAVLAGAVVAVPVAGQGVGTVTGRITDQATGAPLASAQVFVVGTSRGGLTSADGRYTIAGVPAGSQDVRVTLIGYASNAQQVTVAAGQAVTADFALPLSAVELGGVVVTATGREQAKRELGSSVGVIRPEDVQLANVTSFSELLQGRAAGVTVTSSGGTAGAGSRVRIRGSNSISLSNTPLLIVDGVRVDNDPQSYDLFNGGQTASRLNDFSPEEIESIEVLRGPSAAALYGTAAANGVIQITTRRGVVGAGRWHLWSEGSTTDRNFDIPDNVLAVQHRATGDFRCDNLRRGQGICTVDEVYSFSPLTNDRTTPFRTGRGKTAGASVSGGGEAMTYFLSGEWMDELGPMEDNDQTRVNLRANLTGAVRENLTVGARVGYVNNKVQFPQNDNSGLGVILNGLLGLPTPGNVDSDVTQGYGLPRDYLFAWKNFQDLKRTTGSVQGNWRPLSWLSVNSTAGFDDVNRLDNDLLLPNVLQLFGPPFSSGFRETQSYRIRTYTGTGDVSATRELSPSFVSTTSAGLQYFREVSNAIQASGTDLTPGTGSLGGASAGYDVAEANVENRTFGTYLQQQLAWRDRVFVNGAVRGDRNSAFGSNLSWIWYPSFSGSWVVSDESFFPQLPSLSSLRLRGAWGQSGLRPRFRDALQYFSGVTAAGAASDEPGFVITGAGNADLEPERSREIELGFDAGLWNDRLGIQLTHYDKVSRDALVQQPLPPSLGSAAARFQNIARVSNRGWELTLNAEPIQRDNVAWSVTLAGSTNRNRLDELGDNPPIIFGLNGDTQRFAEGFELGGYWQLPITGINDANANGIVDIGEVEVGDTAVYLGRALPNRELSVSTNLTLFKRVRLNGLVDYKGGHKLFNATTWNRCAATASVCAERNDSNTPLAEQAKYVAFFQAGTVAGYIEDADFWKLRELSATFLVPSGWTRPLGARDVSLTLAGRNLVTWSKYSGFDPEVNGSGQSNFNTDDNTTLPPFRTFTARIDVSF